MNVRRHASSLILRALAFAVLATLTAAPAKADFRLCNNTASRVGIAVGYRDKEGWLTEGWWNVGSKSCETVLRGPLARPLLLRICDRLRPGRGVERQVLHVYPREGVHDPRL